MLGSVLIHEFLCGQLIIDMVEGEVLPNDQVRVIVDVFLSLLLIDLCTQVLHDGASLVLSYGDDRSELTAFNALSWQRGPQSDHHLEVVVRLVSSHGCLRVRRLLG